MSSLFTICIYSFVPAYLAYLLATKRGRNGWLWAVLCTGSSYIGLVLLALLPSSSVPTLQEYQLRFPQSTTPRGMRCAHCGSGSIRLWRHRTLLSRQQFHSCNHCGKTLYRSK